MAESFLFSVAENLLGKIGSLALQEVRLAWGLDSDLKKLEDSLKLIKAVLLDAQEKQTQNRALHLWLGRLKNFCYDAEDVLDELEYQGLRKQVVRLYGNSNMKVRRFFSSSNPLIFRPMMGHKVKELRERLDEISAEKSKFHLTELVDDRSVGRIKREMTDSLLHKSNVVGRETDKEILVNKFLLDPIMGGDISVIPIVGLGGLGKTTLASMLYNDEIVGKHFDLKFWVCVSDNFDKKQIMVTMLKCLTLQNRGDLDPDQLQNLIQEKLNSKRFLLVLDDVWSDDRGKWIDFMDLLKGGAAGSKVIVTTRNASVATTVGTVSSYDLKFLSHEQCLSLFKKLAFGEREEDFPPRLAEIGDAIVRKCGGLPLAVRTLGTLLYSKGDVRYWKFIRDSEMWKLPQNDILPALRISYDQMPSHLKSCFAICSIYPKDEEFDNIQLAQIWMANGLLQSSNEYQDILDTGFQYVEELYSRSFLQEFKTCGGHIKFKMHDLVHDLSLSVAESECYVVNTHSKNISDGIRYLSLSDKALLEEEVPGCLRKENKMRTIRFANELQGPACESFVNTCISTCTYLRMMEMRGSLFELLPSSIGDLKHLRYLNLTGNSRLRRLPDSIWKLHNLVTLFLDGCSELEELPRGIKNLINLRFLAITVKQKHLPEDEIGCLTSLHVLAFEGCTNLEVLIEGMQHLTSLRFLHILDCKNLISLPRSLKYLTGLEGLVISNCNRLNLMEEDHEIQDVLVSLQSLTLKSLPLLVSLPQWLKKSFNTLQSLSIRSCEEFSSFPEWFQDFTSLEKISIENCPNMLSLPEWMNRLTALKELTIRRCPMLRKRCKKLVGEDWHKIAHLSNFDIDEDEDEDEAISTA